jgi:ABC-type branched-subunit amino acid transport system substrate-binding protein
MSTDSSSLLYGTRRKCGRARLWCGLCCCLFCILVVDVSAQSPTASLRIGIVKSAGAATTAQSSALKGIELGAAEADQTARLFGSGVKLFEATGDGSREDALAAAGFLSSARKVQVLLAVSADDVEAVSRFAEDHHLIFLNVASRATALRSACRRHSFHVEASDLMYANAARQFASGSGIRPAVTQARDSVVLWDSRLERFGASQINDRYFGMTKLAMDGPAWAGWAAIKIAAEAALRAGSAEPTRLLRYLESPATQFDGHKGWPLSFRAADHQLRQPLYIVVTGRTGLVVTGRAAAASAPRLVDVPDLRSVGTAGADRATVDALDRLSSGSTTHCAWPAP